MRLRKFFVFLPLVCLLVSLANVSSAAGITPLNVAVLPTVITDARYNGGEEVIQKIEKKILRHFRYPYYEVAAPDKVSAALSAADFIVEGKMRKPYDKEALQSIARNLSADIVVVAEVVKARSQIYQQLWFDGDRYVETDVVLNCYTYSAKDGKYDKVKVSARNIDIENVFSGLDTVVPNLTDELLAKIPYKTIINVNPHLNR